MTPSKVGHSIRTVQQISALVAIAALSLAVVALVIAVESGSSSIDEDQNAQGAGVRESRPPVPTNDARVRGQNRALVEDIHDVQAQLSMTRRSVVALKRRLARLDRRIAALQPGGQAPQRDESSGSSGSPDSSGGVPQERGAP
jgi:hypothetical protein